jgi:hypothetical protein
MEESFSDMGDWKAIINLSEEELADVEDEVLFQKMETFKQDLEADLSGHGKFRLCNLCSFLIFLSFKLLTESPFKRVYISKTVKQLRRLNILNS